MNEGVSGGTMRRHAANGSSTPPHPSCDYNYKQSSKCSWPMFSKASTWLPDSYTQSLNDEGKTFYLTIYCDATCTQLWTWTPRSLCTSTLAYTAEQRNTMESTENHTQRLTNDRCAKDDKPCK
ncbi:uncharacterized protein LOC132383219 isoform X2 [Hypanus sabinus]|uniref:uncharacterized protein LOC132383219 isoform X2 n=1 Tax=Hypanus sabinus TaxID=79690 RepID=UPI0028C4CD87|nr:uncharacterized protein LOC132383219 isoform X2 [Hypanus sabinus]